MNEKYSYIERIQNNQLIIYCRDKGKRKPLKILHAKKRFFFSKYWIVRYENDKELSKVLSSLRDAGFLFGYDEHGWCPSGIFQLFRKKGLLVGKFKEIFWRGRNKIETREV